LIEETLAFDIKFFVLDEMVAWKEDMYHFYKQGRHRFEYYFSLGRKLLCSSILLFETNFTVKKR